MLRDERSGGPRFLLLVNKVFKECLKGSRGVEKLLRTFLGSPDPRRVHGPEPKGRAVRVGRPERAVEATRRLGGQGRGATGAGDTDRRPRGPGGMGRDGAAAGPTQGGLVPRAGETFLKESVHATTKCARGARSRAGGAGLAVGTSGSHATRAAGVRRRVLRRGAGAAEACRGGAREGSCVWMAGA